MAWSVSDLTSITDLLTTQLTDAIKASPKWQAQHFPFEVSGLMPEVSRKDGTSVLSFYLLHVSRDPYWRNTPVQGSRAQLNPSQPLSLDLSYLLTTYSEKSWEMEQYLMSVALSHFHAHPINTSSTAEFTVTVEADSIEEMSRLWQAITVPIRLSAMFRVAVVFLAPEKAPIVDMPMPSVATLSVGADLNLSTPVPPAQPRLFEIAIQVAYRVPPGDATQVSVLPTPPQPVLIGGERLRARGSGLSTADANAVFLARPGGAAEWPISAWRVLGTSASGSAGDADELVLDFPPAYGNPPASGTALTATPSPGLYQLAVGNAGTAFRSNSLPVAVAPRMDGIGTGQPVLSPDSSGVYTMHASGLIAGQTSILLDNTALTIGAAAARGVAVVDTGASTVAWMLPVPPGFPSGSYVRVRLVVNGIEAQPRWWIRIP
ncbi:MAG TPA: Pvc16 family protein [Candidatus Angelobacter sp.]|jgi:hypothetical protein|nr:Pvc16 family protein [Candidatus Angelobacter sp.]